REPAQAVLVAAGIGADADDRVGAEGTLEAGRRVERQDPAVVHDRHPVAELVRLLHVVGGEEDRLPGGMELGQDLPQRQAALGVEAGGRLVEEQDAGPVEDGPGDHEPLGHAAGERGDVGLGPVGEAELLEETVRLLLRLVGRHPEVAAVEVEVLPHRELTVEGVRLRHDADDLLGPGGVGHDVDAADDGPTRVVSMPTVVVLPAPLGPRSPKISPLRTDSAKWSTAATSGPPPRPGKVLVRPSVRMISAAAGSLGAEAGAAMSSSGRVTIL